MALTKEKRIDQITIMEDGGILYREVTRIKEDDVQLSETYHRTSVAPGQDTSNLPEKIAEIANLVWTPEIISAFQERIARGVESITGSTPTE